MYESDDIVKYLFNNYGPGEAEVWISDICQPLPFCSGYDLLLSSQDTGSSPAQIPFMLRAGLLTTLTCGVGLAARWAMAW